MYVGTGVQLLGMTFVTMIFAVLGFLSPANRGGLMTAMLLLFVLMGIFAGYFSGRRGAVLRSRRTTRARALDSNASTVSAFETRVFKNRI